MSNFLKLEMISVDRVGIVLDILRKIYEQNISIHYLEVFPRQIHVKVDNLNNDKKLDLIENILSVEGIIEVRDTLESDNGINSIEQEAFKEIVGNSLTIENVKNSCLSIKNSNSTVLLRGESGTGKELFAKAIQRLSKRSDKNFITINCAVLPDNLIESELFGYEKGSFTGARENGKEGLFKIADGGTVFLDEIGELSLPLQAKLLRVLQEGTIRKVGSNKEEKIDVRIIAATNRDLEEMIKMDKFREDLYYRLNVIPIYIPPLRKRQEDIPILINYFINKLNKKLNKNIKEASIVFIESLKRYDFPGNIRELQNIIERSMNFCDGFVLNNDNIFNGLKYKEEAMTPKEIEVKLKQVVEIAEKEAIIRAINKYKSCRKAAKMLGVSHTTIINKLKKYNIYCKE